MMLSSLTEPRQTPPLSLSPQAPLPSHPPVFPSLTAATAAAAAAAAAAAEAMATSNPTSPLSSPHLPTSATDLSRQDLYLSSPVDSVRSSPPAPSPAPPALGSPKSVGVAVTQPRQNQVGTVLLHGEYIVSLMIDNKERLCLAQISNTLLKDFSYNEIHNRRVALGITCVQCTPVQLEILRRAGAMPISSRRCGMISKREAERLVRSFLEESEPPKLPETFAFNVMHSCGWGCSGQFLPSRYNSSRAKCIKCDDCQMFFSPNKFIFHFHRTPDAKYHHPDAANFNSWRRHLRLNYDNPTDELVHVWEDVKAMFNGGSRKRLVSNGNGSGGSGSSKSSHHGGGSGGGIGGGGSRSSAENSKRARLNPQDGSAMMNKMATGLPYPYPVMPMAPNNACSNMAVAAAGAYMSRAPHPAFPFPSPDPSMFHMDTTKAAPTNMAEFWKTKNAAAATAPYVHPFNYFWAKNLALYNDNSTPYRNVLDFSRQTGGKQLPDPIMTGSEKMASPPSSSLTPRSQHQPHSSPPAPPPAHEPPTKEEVDKYFSAFKPVAVRENNNKLSAFDDKLQLPEDRNWMSHDHSDASDMSAGGDDVSNDVSSIADADDTDINVTDVEHADHRDFREPFTPPSVVDTKHPYDDEVRDSHNSSRIDGRTNQSDVTENDSQSRTSPQVKSEIKDEESRLEGDETVVRRPWADSDRIYNMSREELQSELRTMMEERRKAEVEYISMSATYDEKRKRNGDLRDGLERQLHMAKGDLCQEVDDEKVSQQLMQNKLKEAREALQQFSHKMSALHGCIDCN